MKQEISKPLMFGAIAALVIGAVIGGYFFVNRTSGDLETSRDNQMKMYEKRKNDPNVGYSTSRGSSQGQGQGRGYGSGYGGRPGMGGQGSSGGYGGGQGGYGSQGGR